MKLLLHSGVADTVINAERKFLSVIAGLVAQSSADPERQSSPAPIGRLQAEFRDELLRVRDLEPQKRGYAFEAFLKRCFDASGLGAREPFRKNLRWTALGLFSPATGRMGHGWV